MKWPRNHFSEWYQADKTQYNCYSYTYRICTWEVKFWGKNKWSFRSKPFDMYCSASWLKHYFQLGMLYIAFLVCVYICIKIYIYLYTYLIAAESKLELPEKAVRNAAIIVFNVSSLLKVNISYVSVHFYYISIAMLTLNYR